ncbi:MAG: hypothetical protein VCB77_06435, partial [Alphaproteobacteria bacterium]
MTPGFLRVAADLGELNYRGFGLIGDRRQGTDQAQDDDHYQNSNFTGSLFSRATYLQRHTLDKAVFHHGRSMARDGFESARG